MSSPIPTSSHVCGYHNLSHHRPRKLCVLHLSSPREVSRGARKSNGSHSARQISQQSGCSPDTLVSKSVPKRIFASIESA